MKYALLFDGEQGLQKALLEKPDLIPLDIVMPNKDGVTMFKELKTQEATRGIPVVMLSAKSEFGSILSLQELGATDYIIKPYDFQDLVKDIRKYTE